MNKHRFLSLTGAQITILAVVCGFIRYFISNHLIFHYFIEDLVIMNLFSQGMITDHSRVCYFSSYIYIYKIKI